MKAFSGLLFGLAAAAGGVAATTVVHNELADLLEEKLMKRAISQPRMAPQITSLLQSQVKRQTPDADLLSTYSTMITGFTENLATATWALWKAKCSESSTDGEAGKCSEDLDAITTDSITTLKSAIEDSIESESS